MNYPDFAYYTSLTVVPLSPGGPDLYQELNHVLPGSIVIAYRENEEDQPMEPALSWMDSNPRFRRMRAFPKLVLFQRKAQLP